MSSLVAELTPDEQALILSGTATATYGPIGCRAEGLC